MKNYSSPKRVLLADVTLPNQETLVSTLINLPIAITRDFGSKIKRDLNLDTELEDEEGLKRVSFHESLINKIVFDSENKKLVVIENKTDSDMTAYFLRPATHETKREISEQEFSYHSLVIRIDEKEEYRLKNYSVLRASPNGKLFDIKLYRKIQGMSVKYRQPAAFSYLKSMSMLPSNKEVFKIPENGSTLATLQQEQSAQISWQDIEDAYDEAKDNEDSILLPKRSKKCLQKKVSFSDTEQTSDYKRLKKIKQEDKEFCSICYCTCNEITGRPSDCSHRFCFTCIEEWTKITNACPLCKVEFTYIKKYTDGLFTDRVKVEAKKQVHEEEDDSLLQMIENADDYCYFCERTDNTNILLICDKCHTKCCHSTCLDPPMEFIPEGDWFCDYCVVDHGVRSENPTANLFARRDMGRSRSRNRTRRRTGRRQFRSLGGSRSNSRRTEESRVEPTNNTRTRRRRPIVEENSDTTSIVRTRRYYREQENQTQDDRRESLDIELDRLVEEMNTVIRERSRPARRNRSRSNRRRNMPTAERRPIVDEYDTGCFDLNDLIPNRTSRYNIRRSTQNRLLNTALNEAYMD